MRGLSFPVEAHQGISLHSPGVEAPTGRSAGNVMEGWLNTSLRARSPGIVFLDVTEPFPFDDGVFERIS